jgi:hypothetical protein
MSILLALLLFLQQPAPALTLTGEVTQADTTPTVPIENARVELSQGENFKIVRTDARGRYEISGIQPGQYRLKVAADGFAAAEGAPLTLVAGSAPAPIPFKLVRAGTIAGRVLDFDSEPLAGAVVLVHRAVNGPNGRRLNPAGYMRSDDRGEYRFYWLTPGEYYISASYTAARLGPVFVPPNNNVLPPPNGYTPTLYRNAPDLARAEAIQLKPGELRSAVDITLTLGPVVNISGTITDGKTGRGAVAQLLVNGSSEIPGGLSFQGQSDATGKYELRGIPSGNYRVSVYPLTEATPPAVKTLQVALVDIPNFNIVLEPPLSLKGKIATDDGSPLPPLARVSMYVNGPTGSGNARIQPSGEFEIQNLPKGNYTLNSSNWPEDYYLKSATLGRTDALAGQISITDPDPGTFEIVISAGTGRVDGTITGAGAPLPGAQVVLVPEEKLRDRTSLFKTATTDQNGKFSIRSVPPGDYSLFAWESVEAGAYLSRNFLKPYEVDATAIHVEPKSESTVRMPVIPRQR